MSNTGEHRPIAGDEGWAPPTTSSMSDGGSWVPPSSGWNPNPPTGQWGSWPPPTSSYPPPAWHPSPPPPPSGPRNTARTTALTAIIAVLAAIAAGIGIGRVVWHTGQPSVGSNSPISGSGNTGGGIFGGNGGGGSGTGTGNGVGAGPSSSQVNSIAAQVDQFEVDVDSTFTDAAGAGTGIVLTSDGEILTNNHVVEDATSIKVTDIGNGKTYPATVLGYDPTHDVALIQAQGASGLKTATIGNSTSVAVGDDVVAIGNAGGVGGTPTAAGGVITGLNQSITASDELNGTQEQLTGLLETDADVQSGDSGGALVNSSGDVVGIDTAGTQQFYFNTSGDGFAIPINSAMNIVKTIQTGATSGTVHVGPTAELGVLITTSGTGFGNSPSNGVAVSDVVPGGPAATAGIAAGDTLTSVGGHALTTPTSLTQILVFDYHPGQTVPVGYTDASGGSHTVSVTLGTGPAQ